MGYPAAFAFVAIESIGIPFPGETALITAAVYPATAHPSGFGITGIIIAAAAGAIIGDNVGYAIGRVSGWRLIRRYGPRVHFTESRVKVGRYLFMRHGGKVVFFGRFVIGLRTWAAFLAGANGMPRNRFIAFNAAGAVLWAVLYGPGYFYLGATLERASTGVDIAIALALAAVIISWIAYVRRNEARLQLEAEKAQSDEKGLPPMRIKLPDFKFALADLNSTPTLPWSSPALGDYSTPQCGLCQIFAPVLEQIAAERAEKQAACTVDASKQATPGDGAAVHGEPAEHPLGLRPKRAPGRMVGLDDDGPVAA